MCAAAACSRCAARPGKLHACAHCHSFAALSRVVLFNACPCASPRRCRARDACFDASRNSPRTRSLRARASFRSVLATGTCACFHLHRSARHDAVVFVPAPPTSALPRTPSAATTTLNDHVSSCAEVNARQVKRWSCHSPPSSPPPSPPPASPPLDVPPKPRAVATCSRPPATSLPPQPTYTRQGRDENPRMRS
jgi:hypothetical protein